MSYRTERSLILLTASLAACPADPVLTTTDNADSTGEPASTSGPTTTTTDIPTGTTTTPDEPTTTTGDPSTTSTTGDTSSTGPGVDPCTTFLCGAPAACCAADEACVDKACAPACASGVRCGADLATCCADGEVCLGEACTALGGACTSDADCEPGSVCEPSLEQCVPLDEAPTCVHPQGDLAVELTWSYTDEEVVTMPIVVDLDGDAIPEVVINTMRATGNAPDYAIGELICLDGVTGAERWRIPHDPNNNQFGAHGRATLAAGDFTGDGLPDILYPGRPEGPNFISAVHAVDGDGVLLWTARNPDNTTAKVRIQNGAPALVNLDADPMAEIAYGAAIYDHDGLLVWNQNGDGGVVGSPHNKNQPSQLLYSGGLPTFADLTADGYPELVTGREAWSIDWVIGDPPTVTLSLLWQDNSGFAGDGWPAVADLDQNGTPEVVLVAWPEIKIIDGVTGKLWCGVDPTGDLCDGNDAARTPPLDIPGFNLGGPATIADFDGDGRPEFGLTTGSDYIVFDLNRQGEAIVKPQGDPAPAPGHFYPRWRSPVQDISSASTGSVAFDSDADGAAELFYQDECYTRAYDGATGEVRLEIANSTATIHEYPVISEVDGDDRTDLLIVANRSDAGPNANCLQKDPAWTNREGVYLYRPITAWAPTRHAWPQHSYHVTNVESDGNVPLFEQANWTTPDLNNFRQALAGAVLPNAPDLTVSLAVHLDQCPDQFILRATVINIGALAVPAGIDVTFYAGTDATGDEISTIATGEALIPGGSTVVETTALVPGDPANFFAVVDPAGATSECFEANNDALVFGATCPP